MPEDPRGRRFSDDDEEDINENELVQPIINEFSESREFDEDVEVDEDANIDGDDLDDLIDHDYRPIPDLDHYNVSELDNQEYSPLSHAARREVDEQIEQARNGRVSDHRVRGHDIHEPAALDSPSSEVRGALSVATSEPSGSQMTQPRVGATFVGAALEDDEDEDDEENQYVNLDDYAGPLREWILLTGPRREIRRRFRSVLTEYERISGEPTYAPLISQMCANNEQSLHVSYLDLSQAAPSLGIWLADCPAEMLKLFNQEAYEVVLAMFPEYGRVHSGISVRVTNLPVSDKLRDLRQMHLNALVRVSGVVTRRTGVFPQLQIIKFSCGKCSTILGPYTVNASGREGDMPRPSVCRNCESSGPFTINQSETVYRNYQKLTLQESPGTVPAGRVPRTKDIIVTDDLRDCARPGEEIDITGIYANNFSASLNTQHGFPVFSTVIEANYVCKKQDAFADSRLTEEDKKTIRELASSPNIGDRIFRSIAPSIYGHDDIKMALALAMFGGEAKQSPNAHRIRGDINVLVLGDPGTAKSQFLKYAEKTASRAVFTTGKGASAVGLTASVRRDPLTREWTLEGGALVLADTGICLIDEFDKMNEQDRTSIHEAMEQQSISISKAGIITSLQARCAVIAAANPVRGRYDSSCTFAENVELTEPILSRFDILCVVRDTVDPVMDERLAMHVIDSHIESHPDEELIEKVKTSEEAVAEAPPALETSDAMLRKYIEFARSSVHPNLSNIDEDKISQLYVEMRQQSTVAGGVPITVRHVESMLRMAEAHAKMHLRDNVRQDDIDIAVRVMLSSFIGAQKFSVMRTLEHRFRRYMNYRRSENELLLFQLCQLVGMENERAQTMRRDNDERDAEVNIEVSVSELEARAAANEIYNLQPFFDSDMFTEKFSLQGDKIFLQQL